MLPSAIKRFEESSSSGKLKKLTFIHFNKIPPTFKNQSVSYHDNDRQQSHKFRIVLLLFANNIKNYYSLTHQDCLGQLEYFSKPSNFPEQKISSKNLQKLIDRNTSKLEKDMISRNATIKNAIENYGKSFRSYKNTQEGRIKKEKQKKVREEIKILKCQANQWSEESKILSKFQKVIETKPVIEDFKISKSSILPKKEKSDVQNILDRSQSNVKKNLKSITSLKRKHLFCNDKINSSLIDTFEQMRFSFDKVNSKTEETFDKMIKGKSVHRPMTVEMTCSPRFFRKTDSKFDKKIGKQNQSFLEFEKKKIENKILMANNQILSTNMTISQGYKSKSKYGKISAKKKSIKQQIPLRQLKNRLNYAVLELFQI